MRVLSSYVSAIVGVVACAGFCLSGCQHTSPTPAPTKTELLTAHDWFLTSRVSLEQANSAGVVTAPWDVFAVMPNCLKDDMLSFKKDNTFSYGPSTIRCDFDEAPGQSTWGFGSGEERLYMGVIPTLRYDGPFGGPVYGELQIIELSETTMRLRSSVQTPPATMNPHVTTYTFSSTGTTLNTNAQQKAFKALTAHKWRMSSCLESSTMQSSTPVTTDILAQMPPCRRDDFLQFNADYTLVNDEGATRCNVSDPQSHTSSWLQNDAGSFSLKDRNILGLAHQINGSITTQVTDTKLTISFYDSYHVGQYFITQIEYTAF